MKFNHIFLPAFLLLSVGTAAVETPRDITVNGKKWIYRPRQTVPDAPLAATAAEKSAGALFFRRTPKDVQFNTIPQRREVLESLYKFTTPGDWCNLYFVMHNINPAAFQKVSATDFRCGDKTIPAASFEFFDVQFRTRIDYEYPWYTVMPEILEAPLPRLLAAGENLFLWAQIKLPPDTAPGQYSGKFMVQSGGKTLSLPVTLQVLPFQLKQPPVDWCMYFSWFSPGYRNRAMQEELYVRHIKDIMELGVTGLIHHGGIYDEKTVRQYAERFKKAGFHGPLIVDFGQTLEMRLYKEMTGKPISNTARRPFDECINNPALDAKFTSFLRNLNGWMRKHMPDTPWIYQGMDEPHCYSGIAQSQWEYPLAKKAGVRTASTVYPLRELTMFGKGMLDISLNHNVKKNAAMHKELIDAGAAQGTELWMLGPGSYVWGTVVWNRFQSGMLFYKTGLKSCAIWTYMGWSSPRDEFSKGSTNYNIAFPRREFADNTKEFPPTEKPLKRYANSTLQGEGLREGIIDYKYAYTLSEYIRQARQAGLTAAADHADKVMRSVMTMVPWMDDFHYATDSYGKITLDDDAMETIRLLLAAEIIAIKEKIK